MRGTGGAADWVTRGELALGSTNVAAGRDEGSWAGRGGREDGPGSIPPGKGTYTMHHTNKHPHICTVSETHSLWPQGA